jgi:20S proteasome alpha/beta subunit
MTAVDNGWTSVGICCREGIVLASEKQLQSKLLIPASINKIYKVKQL